MVHLKCSLICSCSSLEDQQMSVFTFQTLSSHLGLCSILCRLQSAGFLPPLVPQPHTVEMLLLSLRWPQTSLIVSSSREIRLHSKAELAFPPPPVIRRQVATVTCSFQKFPSTAPLQIPVCSTSRFMSERRLPLCLFFPKPS